MAGTLVDRQLTVRRAGGVRFTVATPESDPAIRALLRANPMRGEVTVSFEREPNYFLGTQAGADDRTILAHDSGRLVCMGRCVVRRLYVNGKVRRVGYLSELRLDSSASGRFDILRRGYQFFREMHRDDPPDCYFSSIAGDNVRSIRFLERGLPGMPVYEFLTEFVTLLIPVPQSLRALRRLARVRDAMITAGLERAPGSPRNSGGIVDCLNASSARHQLAAYWSEKDFGPNQRRGPSAADFQILCKDGKPVACAALWDQRGFRQTVIREYGARTSYARPWINLAARWLGRPGLPRPGSVLAHAFLSPIAVPEDRSGLLPALIAAFLLTAAERGLKFVTVGFASQDPRLAVIRKHFSCREYVSRLYQVSWQDDESLRGGLILPEVALL